MVERELLIKCPNCQTEFDMAKAIKHEITKLLNFLITKFENDEIR